MDGKPLASALRFAVLFHDQVAQPHYDFLLQAEPASPLLTWRFPRWPITSQAQVQRQSDHRTVYLDYEGLLSDGRGRVKRVDAGVCQILHLTPDRVEAMITPTGGAPVQITLWLIDRDNWTATFQKRQAEA